jgi:hypothetical protein
MIPLLISFGLSLLSKLVLRQLEKHQAGTDADTIFRLTAVNQQLQGAVDAWKFKAGAARDPAAAHLRVRDQSRTIELSNSDPESDTLP